MESTQDAQSPNPGDVRALQEAHREAVDAMVADYDYWERVATGQDTQEAEESGRLAGFAEGLETALKILGATTTDDARKG